MSNTLRELMNRGRIDAATAVGILRQLLRGIAFLHWRGDVCGCLTPDSVVLSPKGKAFIAGCSLVLDDELVSIDHDDGPETAGDNGLLDHQNSPLVWSSDSPKPSSHANQAPALDSAMEASAPYYASPEQIAGAKATDRSDLFSLGIVAYEMLAGRHPFGASDGLSLAEVQQRIVRQPPYELSDQLTREWPAHLPAALSQALAKNPGERFADALQFLDALEAGESSSAYAEPAATVNSSQEDAPQPARQETTRKRWPLFTLAAVIVVAAAVAISLLLLDGPSHLSASNDPSNDFTRPTSTVVTQQTTSLTSATTVATPHTLTGGASSAPSSTTTSRLSTPARSRHEEDDPLLTYSDGWAPETAGSTSTGSILTTDTPGSSITITFEGTHLGWIATRGPSFGRARVTMDGRDLGVIDLYNARMIPAQKVWGTGVLPSGLHTVTLTCTGDKNPASTGTGINLDAVEVTGVLTRANE